MNNLVDFLNSRLGDKYQISQNYGIINKDDKDYLIVHLNNIDITFNQWKFVKEEVINISLYYKDKNYEEKLDEVLSTLREKVLNIVNVTNIYNPVAEKQQVDILTICLT